uniref:DPPIV_N domain-containing protein n=1 Tax=Parastrongyloides trichosuri TaxID=131310 RepID=A0A0N5A1U3_PARTI
MYLISLFLLVTFNLSLCDKEDYLYNITKITFGGGNFNSYISDDGKYILYQGGGLKEYGTKCSGIYRQKLSLINGKINSKIDRVTNGLGASSTGRFLPESNDIIFASTFRSLNLSLIDISSTCPQSICYGAERHKNNTIDNICRRPLLMNIFNDYDIYKVNKYGNIIGILTNDSYYNNEPAPSPDGSLIAYSSSKSGSLNIWLMNSDGNNKKQLTNNVGYTGLPSWSPSGKYILYTAYIPKDKEKIKEFNKLLSFGLVDISSTEIHLVSIDGKINTQLTFLNSTSFSTTWITDNAFIFSSNYESSFNGADDFALYIFNITTMKVIRITFNEDGFDSFPSYNKKLNILTWSSNRNRNVNDLSEFNIYMAYLGKEGTKPILEEEHDDGRIKNKVKDYLKMKDLHYPGEKHLKNIHQLTFGGKNAEGYFVRDDTSFIFQAMGPNYETNCDQIYHLDLLPHLPSSDDIPQRLSSGLGATTCSYLFPSKMLSLHASTIKYVNLSGNILGGSCPQKKCSHIDKITDETLKHLCNTSYVWDIFPSYDIYLVNQFGNYIKRLTDTYGYDAEGTISPDGSLIVYTSMASGDLELWIMNADGSDKRQLTDMLGYDGGAFFSPDGNKIIFRASRPKTEKEIKKYKLLLSYGLVEPLEMELFVINVDGTGLRQVTSLGGSNWAPYYLTDNKRILFSSNFNGTNFGEFHIYIINDDGTGLEKVTNNTNGFNSFPMISYSGKNLIFGSNRNGNDSQELNLFFATWID